MDSDSAFCENVTTSTTPLLLPEANLLSLFGTGLISALGLPPNTLLLWLILKNFQTTKPHEWLLFNLTLTDFILCLNGLILQVPFSFPVGTTESVSCKIGGLASVVFSLISIFCVPHVSCNRYISLYYPQKYKKTFTKKNIMLICASVWTFWILMAIPVIAQNGAGFDQATGICAIIITSSTHFQATAAMIVVCLTVIANGLAGYFAYKVIKRLRQHKAGMIDSNIKSHVLEESRQVVIVVALILAIPLFTHVPFITLRVVQIQSNVNWWISGLITGLFPLSQCCNPFLTMFGVKRYKLEVKRMFSCGQTHVIPIESRVSSTRNVAIKPSSVMTTCGKRINDICILKE